MSSNNVPNETNAQLAPTKLPTIPPIYATNQLVPNEPPPEIQHTTRRVYNKHHETKTTKPNRYITPGQESSKHSRETKTQIILMYTKESRGGKREKTERKEKKDEKKGKIE